MVGLSGMSLIDEIAGGVPPAAPESKFATLRWVRNVASSDLRADEERGRANLWVRLQFAWMTFQSSRVERLPIGADDREASSSWKRMVLKGELTLLGGEFPAVGGEFGPARGRESDAFAGSARDSAGQGSAGIGENWISGAVWLQENPGWVRQSGASGADPGKECSFEESQLTFEENSRRQK
jgi:hypothetical protein